MFEHSLRSIVATRAASLLLGLCIR
jgi:hypothetical protein